MPPAAPTRRILHVDMDAFYAAVEQRDRPELRGRPVIVGADPQGGHGRGVVATASYEARKFGVGSAMPISQAFRACPHGVYLRPDMDKYAAVSKQVFEVLRRFTDLVEPISIDEAFLDVTGALRATGHGSPAATAEALAARLKAAIVAETGLTASVGLATSKMVAKVASDMRKPDGLVVVPPGGEAAFLAPLPVRRLWGVGPKMEEALARLGLHTIGDLAAADTGRLESRLGDHAAFLQELARGIDDRPVDAHGDAAKSIGQEHTFDTDTGDPDQLRRMLLGLADAVARRVREHGVLARTVTLKYRDERFVTVTRAHTMKEGADRGDALFEVAWRLFEKVHGERGVFRSGGSPLPPSPDRLRASALDEARPERGRHLKVRLLGIYASGFGPAQLGLFAHTREADRDRVRDEVEERFGEGALTRASLLRRPGEGDAQPAADRKGSRRLRK